MNGFPIPLKSKPRVLGTLLAAAAVSGGVAIFGLSQSGWQIATNAEPEIAEPRALPSVAALGRLEPQGEIVQIAAPLALDGDRLAELLVQQGDTVQAGDPIAILDSRDRLQDQVMQAQMQIRVAEAKLAQVRAGAKAGAISAEEANVVRQSADLSGQLRTQREEISRLEAQSAGDRAAQTATVNRLQAELRLAETERDRYKALHTDGAVSASIYDDKQLRADTTRQALAEARAILTRTSATNQRQLQEARAELARLESTGQAQLAAARSRLDEVAEVRLVDLQMARTELDAAKVSLLKAQNDLARATIAAPQAGQILEIHTRPGEQIGDEGIVALGQTERMLAIAEVYQSDIQRVKLGQQAIVRGQAFAGELHGKVIEIGRQISRQSVFSGEPGENLDRRVVEVKIAFTPAASQQVANLSNLQVRVVIAVTSQP